MIITNGASILNLGPGLRRDVWIFAAISIVTVILRIVSKARMGKFAQDDVLCTSLTGSTILTIGIENGYGQQVWNINTEDVPKVIMYDYLSQTFCSAGGVIGRTAFTMFIISILGTRKPHRIMLWALIGAQIIINTLFILIIFLQCPGHASAINNKTGEGKTESSAIIALNSATDLYLAIFSAYISWNLKLNFRIKFGLTGLLGLGIFAMIASTIKTVQIQVLVSVDSDPTVATVDLERWLYIETYLVLITLRLQYPVSGH
ncbi:conserved hypothetical protein [Talaromyces marneffei ATCC 18224]|uniref:Rhodopsin domain-containing protein n=1 Tax=Talaromyces marneffei (strain ATCC 18224 / CBS 334.59 / QM 7333) TaxID=441960 RepID=B6Q3D1_TALMQ|nr:conserved hypothetical protein [Talaromyces marneffei ATCC 18224]